jgi:hypothetical protein
MATDQLAKLVERATNNPSFIARAQSDLEGTLAAEGIALSPEELAVVRDFRDQMANASPEEVRERLTADMQGYAG